MGNNSVPKFIILLSRFPVYRGSVLGRFYFITINFFFCVTKKHHTVQRQVCKKRKKTVR